MNVNVLYYFFLGEINGFIRTYSFPKNQQLDERQSTIFPIPGCSWILEMEHAMF